MSLHGENVCGLVDSCTVMLKLLCLFFYELNSLLVFKLLASLQLAIARLS